MLAGGMALESADMIATGLGFLSGYARSQGEQLALSGNLPFTASPDPTVFVVNE